MLHVSSMHHVGRTLAERRAWGEAQVCVVPFRGHSMRLVVAAAVLAVEACGHNPHGHGNMLGGCMWLWLRPMGSGSARANTPLCVPRLVLARRQARRGPLKWSTAWSGTMQALQAHRRLQMRLSQPARPCPQLLGQSMAGRGSCQRKTAAAAGAQAQSQGQAGTRGRREAALQRTGGTPARARAPAGAAQTQAAVVRARRVCPRLASGSGPGRTSNMGRARRAGTMAGDGPAPITSPCPPCSVWRRRCPASARSSSGPGTR